MEEEIKLSSERQYSELISENLDRFLDELSALNDTLPTQMLLVNLRSEKLYKKLEGISSKFEEVDENGSKKKRFIIKEDKLDELPKIHKEIKRLDIARKILPRNFIVSIVSQYDAFLGELVRVLYRVNPNLIRSSEKELNVEDLFHFDSIDELREHIVDKEVDSLLREEHYEQLKSLEKRITKISGKDFTLTSELPILPCFVELTQRRNLFVHTNGLTTRQYLAAKTKWKFETECTASVNEELIASPKYCKKAYRTLFEISIKLTHVLWRKFLPSERQFADEHLNHIIYELLIDKNYSLALVIADFATNVIKKFSTEQTRKIIIINKAIAYKMLDKEQNCRDVINSEDWSIGNEFKLAKFVLEDNYEEAKKMMLKIGDMDEMVNKKAYQGWPLFNKFRKSNEFKEAYLELFNEEFSLEEVQEVLKVDSGQIIEDDK